jgi:predicted nucleic acid-binding protein
MTITKSLYRSRKYLQFTPQDIEKLANKVGLTVDQLKSLHKAATATWQSIAYDIFQCDEGNDIKRAILIEVVLDANHIDTYGKQYLTPELTEWLQTKATKYDLDWVYSAFAPAFPFPSEGM